MSRLAVFVITAALLILAPQALAKHITGAKVCGASDCRDVQARGLLVALPDLGDPTDPPRSPAGGWYRTTMTVSRLDGFEARPPAAAPDPAPGGDFPWAWVAAVVSFGAAAAAYAMRRRRGGRFGHPGTAAAD